MFRGHFEHAIDSQGRVAIPARFRDALARLHDERLVLTKLRFGARRALDVYPLSAWVQLEQRVKEKNRFDPKIIRFRNFYIVGAHECPIDGQGRILLPARLRAYAGLTKDVLFTGEIDMFRIWDLEAWERAFAEDEQAFADDPNLLGELEL